ncbi:MAG: hypothetical protein CTY18_07885 [Methylomonas sp.]|nr:MAG: hypothetical protein CTY18_07885 [Methylomonas sp.]
MTQSHDLQLHITQLQDIRNILNAMKNLAFIEIHKLSQNQASQQQATGHIHSAMMEVLHGHPDLNPQRYNVIQVLLVLGSERGFCGDFNDRLLAAAEKIPHTTAIAVGNRLVNRLPSTCLNIQNTLAGANVSEEIPVCVNQLAGLIQSLKKTSPSFALTVLYHDKESSELCNRSLWPVNAASAPQALDNPPILQLPPQQLFTQLAGHYWFVMLNQLLQDSLLAENHKRLQHLEGAVQHLDNETARLHRKAQIYRQEEITEEIEVILLNSDNI